ncbi:response regulator transcription factor [Pseudonocardia ailaonensis]|uniref:Response regulator transcription factor n=2 Tax=Pseudonocardia ailaonensis TaxID=367279 RepID=A0ABN2NLE5_9PSEU
MFVPSQATARSSVPPYAPVLVALPMTAASTSVLRSLRADGMPADLVSDGIAVLDSVRASPPALLVLDVDLPGPEHAAVLAAVHAESPSVPVVVLTPRERRSSVIAQLRSDRDDYVLRPFAVDELSARIRLRLRLVGNLGHTMIRRGELLVDTELGEVSVDGTPVSLSPTEFAMLNALLAEPGATVSHDELATQVWSEPASANLVQVYISYLRRKIGADRIRTVRGAGYVLEG